VPERSKKSDVVAVGASHEQIEEVKGVVRFLIGLCGILMIMPAALLAQPQNGCDEKASVKVRVDQGHPWRPPFGVDRVGAPITAHVELTSDKPPQREYSLAAYRSGLEIERQPVKITGKKSPFFGNVQFNTLADAVVLFARCTGEGPTEELARQAVAWREIEAEAVARPDRQINPVDLGTILVPHDWLLVAGGQSATIDVAVISRTRNIPKARLRAWFQGGKPLEAGLPLAANQRATKELRLPITVEGDHSILRMRLMDGDRELWKKDIQTMVIAQRPRWPTFGAIETKLRYDAPIPVKDPQTGARSSINYDTAWDAKLKDVVVFLPNGSRFVFWRGSNYIPFWAGLHNTGFCYEWAETTHPEDGAPDSVEPLADHELRYGNVRILESTSSRVHVRWTYQPTNSTKSPFRIWGDQATEDFYFYPDGFGTRVMTLTSAPNWRYELSEFIVFTPQAAFPLSVLHPRVDVLFLNGERKHLEWPRDGLGGEVTFPSKAPMLFRIFDHKDDPVSAIYFSPKDVPGLLSAYGPFYDGGQEITPAFWGSHGPLSRDDSLGREARELIMSTPAHTSLMTWGLSGEGKYSLGNNPEPLSTSTLKMVDTLGRSREMMIRRWAWLIAKSEAPDEVLLKWAQSFSSPPALEIRGARIDFPSYSPERRAIRLVVESPSIDIKLKPVAHTVNPVFELDQAPKNLSGVTLDGKPLRAAAYAWDGATLWVKANIGAAGAKIGVRFDQ